jgi:Zn-dependent peptidase ImmA (M78 family)
MIDNMLKLLFILLIPIDLMACVHGFFPNTQNISISYSKSVVSKNIHAANIVEHFTDVYAPIFAKENKDLQINFLWDEANLNAYATRDQNNNPIINITGGLANHDLITKDSLSLILCHEIGHFLGGAPKKLRGRSTKKSWSSAEGQADYYATAFCIKKVLKSMSNQQTTKSKLKSTDQISKICNTPICNRVAAASLNLAKIYAEIDYFNIELSISRPDDNTTYNTIYGHSNPQCRLDTMISGLRCPNSESILFDNLDPIQSSCIEPEFRRPRCWYYPEIY